MTERDAEVDTFIAVGANIAPERNIVRGLDLLRERVTVWAVSPFYWSRALRRPEQPDYLDGIVCARTAMPARALKFDVLRSIEAAVGRVRSADAYAARELDMDLILYGDCVIREPDLDIPSPEIRARNFVAIPLAELAPDLTLPDTGLRLAEIAAAMDRAPLRPAAEFGLQLSMRLGV